MNKMNESINNGERKEGRKEGRKERKGFPFQLTITHPGGTNEANNGTKN